MRTQRDNSRSSFLPSRRAMIELGVLFALSVLSALLVGCGTDKSTKPTDDSPPIQDDKYFALPFSDGFEGTQREVKERWAWATEQIPAGALKWILEVNDRSSGAQSIRTPVNTDGWMCANSSSVCWSGCVLMTAKPLDLTSKTSAQLSFMNKRHTTSLAPIPGCWDTTVNELTFRVQWRNEGDPTWSTLQDLRGSVSQWELETISMNSLVGRKVYIGFKQLSHCTTQGQTSASWQIDDVTITGQ